jgi:hypothetical protein
MRNPACFVASHLKTKDKCVAFNQAAQKSACRSPAGFVGILYKSGPVSRSISPKQANSIFK